MNSWNEGKNDRLDRGHAENLTESRSQVGRQVPGRLHRDGEVRERKKAITEIQISVMSPRFSLVGRNARGYDDKVSRAVSAYDQAWVEGMTCR